MFETQVKFDTQVGSGLAESKKVEKKNSMQLSVDLSKQHSLHQLSNIKSFNLSQTSLVRTIS